MSSQIRVYPIQHLHYLGETQVLDFIKIVRLNSQYACFLLSGAKTKIAKCKSVKNLLRNVNLYLSSIFHEIHNTISVL